MPEKTSLLNRDKSAPSSRNPRISKPEFVDMSEDTTNNHQDTKVVVYNTSWCAFCHTEMEWLKKLGIDFVSKDIEADPGAKEELLNKNGGNFQGVPVTDINGELVLGFDRPKLQDLLRKNGLLSD